MRFNELDIEKYILPKGEAGVLVAKETIWVFDEYRRKNSSDSG